MSRSWSAAALVFSALLSHWRRRPLQLCATLLGLALATALWTGVQALNEQARLSYDRAAAVLGGPAVASLAAADGGQVAPADYARLRRAGWAVSPVLEARARISGRSFAVIGVDPVTLPDEAAIGGGLSGFFGDGGQSLVDIMTPPFRAVASPGTIAEIETLAGDAAPRLASGAALPPLTAAPSLADGFVILDIGAAQTLLGRPEAISRLLIDPGQNTGQDSGEDPGQIGGAAAPLADIVGARLIWVAPQTDGELARLTDSFHLNLTAFGLLAFVVGLFIVHAAAGLAFEQRLGVFRTLRALGVSARGLGLALLTELLVFALAAGLVGAALGYLIAAALLPDVAATLRGLYGARVPGELSLRADWWLLGVAASLAGALLAAGGGALKAAGLPILASASPEAWTVAEARRRRVQLGLAALLLAGAAAAFLAGGGLTAAFAALAGLLLGAALALPSLLALALSAAARLSARWRLGPVTEWFWADGRQQVSALSLALMALLLALATNIGVGAMVESFRSTFTTWLDRRLAAELYLSPRDQSQAAEMAAWLSAREDVREILPLVWIDMSYRGAPIDLMGFDAAAPTYAQTWPLLAGDAAAAWPAVAQGDAALVSEQLARRAGIAVGDAIALPTPSGPWALRAAGVYPDYGNPEGGLVVDRAAMTARFASAELRSFGVRTDPAAAEALLAAARERFGLDASRSIDQAALKTFSTRVFETTFAVTSALSALTFAVAGLALFLSLLTLSAARIGQLAPLWAMGLTRPRLLRLELFKAGAMALITAALAVPLGVATAWVLVAVVNVEAFGWRLPLRHYPDQWLASGALALAAAALAALPAALRIRRSEPAALLSVFAGDR